MIRARAVAGFLVTLAVMLAVMAAVVLCTAPETNAEEDAGPFPVRLVVIDPTRVPGLLQTEKELIAAPRSRFEAFLARAKQRARAAQSPPRLMEAHYQATLEGESLSGQAEWKILNNHDEEAVLPLDPCNLALRPGVLLNGRPAILGELGNKSAGVLIGPGWQTLRFAWSIRAAETGPAGLAFDLQTPAAAVASLQVDLPTDREVAGFSADELLAVAAESSHQTRRWRTACGGRSQISFIIRPAKNPGRPAWASARQHARHTVTPAGVESAFELEVQAHHGRIAALTLECESSFEVTTILGRQVRLWDETRDDERKQLVVQLTEPTEGRITLEVQGRSPFHPGERRRFPLLRVRNAHAGRQSQLVRIAKELDLHEWLFGEFQPTRFEATGPDGFETLWLVRGDYGDAEPILPSAVIARQRPDLLVRQDSWWHIARDDSHFMTQLSWHARGDQATPQLALRLPSNWHIRNLHSDVKVTSPNRRVRFSIDTSRTPSMLVLDLDTPLEVNQTLGLAVRLRCKAPALEAPAIEIPQIVAREGRLVSNTLALTLEPGLELDLGKVRASPSAPPLGANLPWAGQSPVAYFTSAQALAGDVQVRSGPAQLKAHSTTELIVRPVGRPLLRYLIRLRAIHGTTRQIDLVFSRASRPLAWTVTVGRNELAGPPLVFKVAAGSNEPLETHRLTLARPLSEPILLRAETELDAAQVPLVMVAGSHRPEAALVIRLPPGNSIHYQAAGLDPAEPPMTSSNDVTPIWKAFRFEALPVAFELQEADPARTISGNPIVESARLECMVGGANHVQCHYSFRLIGPAGVPAKVALPDDAQLLGVWKEGARLAEALSQSGKLTLTCEGEPIQYQIAYVQPSPETAGFRRLHAPSPRWDGEVMVPGVRRLWHLPNGLVPAWPACLIRADGALSSPRQQTRTDVPPHESPSQEAKSVPASAFPRAPAPDSFLTTWETPDEAAGESIVCIRRSFCHLAGAGLALVLWLAVWRLRSRALRIAVGATWFLAGMLGLIWLPTQVIALAGWPALAVVAWLSSGVLRRGLERWPVHFRLAALSGLFPLFFVPAPRGLLAAEPTPTLVYVVRAPAGQADGDRVLLPRSLWNQLERWQGDSPDRPDYAFVQADYSAELKSGRVDLQIDHQVHVFRDGPVTVCFPVSEARLNSLLLDGAPVLAASDEKGDCRLEVQGKGLHSLRLALEIPLAEGASSFRFRIPTAGVARLVLRSPMAMAGVEVLGIQGGQQIVEKDQALHADLGRISELRVRWRAAASIRTVPRVREVHYLELQPGEQRLRSVFHYETQHGEVDRLSVAIPQGARVRTVELRSEADEAGPAILSDWLLTPGDSGSQLELRLRRPARGRFRVHLDLLQSVAAPREWIGRRAMEALALPGLIAPVVLTDPRIEWLAFRCQTLELRLPLPADAERLGGVFAYRVLGLRPELLAASGLTPLLQPGGVIFPQADFGPFLATSVLSFPAGAVPRLRLRLSAPLADVRASQDVRLALGANDADVRALIRVEQRKETVPFLELLLTPPMQVAQVEGDVQSWLQVGSRLQIWLRHGAGPIATLTLSARISTSRDPKGLGTLRLPSFNVLGASPGPVRVEVRRREPVAVRFSALRGLVELPEPSESAELVSAFAARQGRYAGSLQVLPGGPDIRAQWLVRLSQAKERVAFQAESECALSGLPRHSISVRFKDWQGDELRVEGDQVREFRRRLSGPDLVCTIFLTAERRDALRFRMIGTLPIEANGKVVVPRPVIEHSAGNEVWLTPLPAGLLPAGQSLPSPSGDRIPWPADGEALVLHRRPHEASRKETEVKLVEYRTRPLDDGRLLQLASYQLLHEAGAGWVVEIPEDATLVAVKVNDVPVSWRGDELPSLRVSLAPGAGWSRVSLLWMQHSSRASMALPRVKSSIPFPAFWTYHVEPGSAATAQVEAGTAAATQRLIALAGAWSQVSLGLRQRFPEYARTDAVADQIVRCDELVRSLLEQADQLRAALSSGTSKELDALLANLQALEAQRSKTGLDSGRRNEIGLRGVEDLLFARAGLAVHRVFNDNPEAIPLDPLVSSRFPSQGWWSLVIVMVTALGILIACAPLLRRPKGKLVPKP